MISLRCGLALVVGAAALPSGCFSPNEDDFPESSSSTDDSGTGDATTPTATEASATDPEASASDPEASATDPEASATDPEATATEPDTSATDPTETGEPVDCAGPDGEVDGACPAEAPVCVGGTCSGCGEAPDGTAACSAADPTTPICGSDGACSACSEHDECPTGACRIATGECFAEANRLWVDNTAAGCATGTGSEDAPFCQITTALDVITDQAGNDPWAVLVAGSPNAYTGTIDPDDDRAVAVIGPSEGLSAVLEGGASYAIDMWAQSPETYVAHLTLRAQNNVMRGGGGCDLYLSDVAIDSGEIGISTGSCTVHTLRSLVTNMFSYGADVENGGTLDAVLTDFDNGSGGMIVSGTARLHGSFVRNHYVGGGIEIQGGHLELVNSFVTYNQYQNDGIANADGTMDILYSTVVGAITCSTPGAVTIRNSIVLNHQFEAGLACAEAQVDHSVVNAGDDQGEGNVLATSDDLAAIFVDPTTQGGDYHVLPDSIASGVAVWQTGDPTIDADGDARPDRDGAADYAGADVP